MTDTPIFLAGIDRSGIGLLGDLLAAHPEVVIARRINFWDFYADRFGDLADPENLRRCLSSMMRYTRVRRLDPDIARLEKDFLQGEASYPRLFRLLQEQNMQRLDKKRWGDKSLNSEEHAGVILSAFPGAVMVHMVRDPRDRYASQANHRSAGRGGTGSGTASWLWSARLARKHGHRYPGRYLALRYEDLVSRPEEILKVVCDLAGLEFSTAMFETSRADSEPIRVHTESIGRFRQDLSASEIRFIERVAGAEMRLWGYEPSEIPLGPGEGFRFTVSGLPLALAGLALWRPWAALRRLTGARPSARRTVR